MSKDEEIVEYCASCNSLHLLEDNGVIICGSCGAVNFYSISPNIEDYLKKVKKDNGKGIPS